MRIAIDCRKILNPKGGESAGIGHYVSGIVRALLDHGQRHSFSLFFDERMPEAVIQDIVGPRQNVQVIRLAEKKIPIISSHFQTAREFARSKPDVLFAPHGQLPLGYRGSAVITVHDFAIYRHPEWFPDKQLGRIFSTRIVVPRSVRAAAKIISVSKHTQKDLIELFPCAKGKIAVVHEAVDTPDKFIEFDQSMKRRYSRGNYLLTVGTLEPRKNFSLAVKGFDVFLDQCPQRVHTTRLVLVGGRGWLCEGLLYDIDLVNREWAPEGYEHIVHEVGYVSNEEKWALLKNATALIYPSHYEGFGLPVLEAMSVGTPVIATRESSIPEVAGDAAVYVSGDDPIEMGKAIKKIVLSTDLRDELGKKGKERARKFSWDRAAKETLAVLESV